MVGETSSRRGSGVWQLALGVLVIVAVLAVMLHDTGDDHAAAHAALKPADPVKVHIASLRLNVAVAPSAPRDQQLPANEAGVVTWASGSAQPGSGHGQTVIAGRTGSLSESASRIIQRLKDVTTGTAIDVATHTGTMRYQVQQVRTLSAAQLAAARDGLLSQHGGIGRLVLVSSFDQEGSTYTRNVLILATPTGPVTS